jgi:ABC-type transport system involved in multi-copper enzyme maturation permease subunit
MFAQVLTTEFMKLRRSNVPWGTLAGLSMAPLGLALFMWILREPGRAASLGLLGAKANLSGLEATGPAYLSTLAIVFGVSGMLLLPFIVAYIFGREYVEATAKNMLALPVARHWFVLAKMVVAAVWWLVLVAVVLAESLLIGLALGLPGFSAAVVASAAGNSLLAAAISLLFVPVIAWITVTGRGYMAPLAFAFAMMALGNVFGKTGWAEWFPWSIVPLMVGLVGTPQSLPAGSYVVLAATFVVGIAATIGTLQYADNAQ